MDSSPPAMVIAEPDRLPEDAFLAASGAQDMEVDRRRRRAAWGGVLVTGSTTLGVAWCLMAALPLVVPGIFEVVGGVLGNGVLGLGASWTLATFAALVPALAALPVGLLAAGRVHEASREGTDVAEAAAAGSAMGATVVGVGALLWISACSTSAAGMSLAMLALAQGLAVVGVMAHRAIPAGRRGSRPLPPLSSLALGAGLQGPALLAGLGGVLLAATGLEKVLGFTLLGWLPWAAQPIAAGMLSVLALAPVTALLARLAARLVPDADRASLTLGLALPAVVPLLFVSRNLFRVHALLGLVPLLYMAAGSLLAGTHAAAAWWGTRSLRTRHRRDAITDHGGLARS